MDYEIREVAAFSVAGYQWRVPCENEENLSVIPTYWDNLKDTGKMDKLMAMASAKGVLKGASVGVCMDLAADYMSFTYLIGVEPASDTPVEGMVQRLIPASTRVVFKGNAPLPEGIQNLWKEINHSWFPHEAYERAEGPELEVYLDEADGATGAYEVWIPVTRK